MDGLGSVESSRKEHPYGRTKPRQALPLVANSGAVRFPFESNTHEVVICGGRPVDHDQKLTHPRGLTAPLQDFRCYGQPQPPVRILQSRIAVSVTDLRVNLPVGLPSSNRSTGTLRT
jgi:hypothetical protein